MSQKLSTQNTTFEDIRHVDQHGNEYWYARELMPLLEYTKWENFSHVIRKAKKSFEKSYQQTDDHFAEVRKKITIAAGTNKRATRKIRDLKLTRHACYVIAQNGDSSKEAIALAQNYFASQTRKRELAEKQKRLQKRFEAREKLKETEKKLSGVLSKHNVKSHEIGQIRSSGDATLFGLNTREMKKKLDVPQSKPLADHLPTITLKAKDFAAEMTTHQTIKKNLQGKAPIAKEHVHNNKEIRKLLTSNGIFPEELPAEEDISKIKTQIPNPKPQNAKKKGEIELLSLKHISVDITGIFDKEFVEKLHKLIKSNPGETEIKVFYGSTSKPKMVRRKVALTQEMIEFVRDYVIY